MKNEGFKPPIYGLEPLKMEVLGSHGMVSNMGMDFLIAKSFAKSSP